MIDVLDHVLDKGVVIDAWIRVALAGIDLVSIEARIVVASIATYLSHAGALGPSRTWRPGVPSWVLENQLRRVREEIEHRHFEPHPQRRAEDRQREALHDARARTITRRRVRTARRESSSRLNA